MRRRRRQGRRGRRRARARAARACSARSRGRTRSTRPGGRRRRSRARAREPASPLPSPLLRFGAESGGDYFGFWGIKSGSGTRRFLRRRKLIYTSLFLSQDIVVRSDPIKKGVFSRDTFKVSHRSRRDDPLQIQNEGGKLRHRAIAVGCHGSAATERVCVIQCGGQNPAEWPKISRFFFSLGIKIKTSTVIQWQKKYIYMLLPSPKVPDAACRCDTIYLRRIR